MEISYEKYSIEDEESSQDQDYSDYSENSDSSNEDSRNESDASSRSDRNEQEEAKDHPSEWKEFSRQNKLNFSLPAFSQNPSPHKDLKQLTEPIEFFSLFFDDNLFMKISDLTDKYHVSKRKTNKRRSHHKLWVKPDLPTIKCYFGQFLYMGIIKKPTIDHYWSTSELFGSPGFSVLLSEDHFS